MTERADPSAASTGPRRSPIKETLISIIIAFVLAFVFRAFVIEAFVIPTGSMAPTLLGAHIRVVSPYSGYDWPVGPISKDRTGEPTRVQAGPDGHGWKVTDPMTGETIEIPATTRRAGDRILVLKYLRRIYDPARWDVVVFKSPVEPQTNFIKRLVGLPGEQVALVDGDAFVRDAAAGAIEPGTDGWSVPGWRIARKPERVQREVWQPIYDSRYAAGAPAGTAFRTPWTGLTEGWDVRGPVYTYAGGRATHLGWNGRGLWEINDRYAYNQTPWEQRVTAFPVSDLRMSAGIEPGADGLSAAAVVRAREHEFRADITPTGVTLSVEPLQAAPGREPARATFPTESPLLRPGHVTNVEFWHADQMLSLYADGELIGSLPYEWSPAERIERATGMTPAEVVERDRGARGSVLVMPESYRPPAVRWEFSGAPLRLYRVGLARDIFYQPGLFYFGSEQGQQHTHHGEPTAATHPTTVMTLGPDQFFVLGDNSPASSDARAWDLPDPWVAHVIDPTPNVAHRDLMIGRAFFVYFPSLLTGPEATVPVPDFGRMRWIW